MIGVRGYQEVKSDVVKRRKCPPQLENSLITITVTYRKYMGLQFGEKSISLALNRAALHWDTNWKNK